MSDVECPYCHEWQEINHDDGYGYDEDEYHEQGCVKCGKEFRFTTRISYTYTAYCQDSDHAMVPAGDKWPALMLCENCEYFASMEES